MVKYYLIENKLSPDSDYYTARVIQQETVNFTEVVKLTTRRGVTITDTELIGAINELTYTIVDLLNSGKIVETPFARFKPSIGGVFNSKDDAFDLARHTVKILCSMGKSIKIDTENMVFEKVRYSATTPLIDRILDYATQEENGIISAGGAAEISGELLKIDTNDPEQGLFLHNNGTTVKIEVIIRNLPSDLIFNVPAGLEAGSYQLEIRNKTNKTDKQLKNFVFPTPLTVA
ncbi:MAG: DUF4469 domain-containing protein [Chloroflexia bacterium]|nr:DUF4469 domain-containing protein [Chloroflexia bacterium]